MPAVKLSDLTKRQGKVLRYLVCRNRHGEDRIQADDCIVRIEWSDLPQNHLQAINTLGKLIKLALAKKDKRGYVATAAGVKLIAKADEKGMWNKPPSRKTTNEPRR
jgi:hypothetical protein